MESSVASLKKELVHHKDYQTWENAKASLFEYVEVFYSSQRLHSSLGYKTPAAFEQAAWSLNLCPLFLRNSRCEGMA